MANYYAISGGGNWSSANTWASSTGQSVGGAGVPTSADNVYIDGTLLSSSTVTLDSGLASGYGSSPTAYANSMNFTGCVGTINFNGGQIQTAGNLTMGANMQISGNSSFVVTGTCSYTSNSITDIYFYVEGTCTFADNPSFDVLSCGYYTNNCVLNTNGRTVTLDDWMNIGNAGVVSTCVVNLGSSTINTTAVNFYGPSTFNAGTSNIITGQLGTDVYGQTYYNATAAEVNGANTFNNLTMSGGSNAYLQGGATQTINGGFYVTGNPTLQTTGGSQAVISQSSGIVSCTLYALQGVKATGGATFYAGASCTDLGDNSGWLFLNGPFLYTGSLSVQIELDSSYYETGAFLYTGSISVKIEPGSTYNEIYGYVGGINVDIVPGSIYNANYPYTGAVSFQIEPQSTYSDSFIYYTGNLNLLIIPNSPLVISNGLGVTDALVGAGCPQCGTLLYNR